MNTIVKTFLLIILIRIIYMLFGIKNTVSTPLIGKDNIYRQSASGIALIAMIGVLVYYINKLTSKKHHKKHETKNNTENLIVIGVLIIGIVLGVRNIYLRVNM